MGDDILPADPAGDADDIRANTVGFQPAAQMGRRVGEVAHEVSDGTLLPAGYLMAASIVALKCLNLVPDLAAWMIPEGDTAFSTRNFGEGVAQQAKMTATGAIGTMTR